MRRVYTNKPSLQFLSTIYIVLYTGLLGLPRPCKARRESVTIQAQERVISGSQSLAFHPLRRRDVFTYKQFKSLL